MRIGIICLAIFSYAFISAQDLRGKWVASVNMGEKIEEFTLSTKDGNFYTGESYDESYNGAFCNYTFIAKFDPSTQELLAKDENLIDKSESHSPVVYQLKYFKKANTEYLSGIAQIVYPDGSLGNPIRALYMREIPDKVEEEIKKEISPEEIKAVKEYKESRQNPVKATLRLQNPKVKIKIHDYGKEDNDSISVIYNDNLIAYKIPINAEDKEFEIEMLPNENNQLTFIAHNLGEIPPNTTYVEILADNKVFKYTLFTDLKKNAVINLRLNASK